MHLRSDCVAKRTGGVRRRRGLSGDTRRGTILADLLQTAFRREIAEGAIVTARRIYQVILQVT